MAKQPICNECGRPFPLGYTGSVCPRCLLKRGLERPGDEPPPSRADRDRNLLFGVFAIQFRLVTKDQFVETAAAWAVDPEEPLSRRFVRHGILTEEQCRFVERLVDEAVQLHHGNERAALDSLDGEEVASRIIHSVSDSSTGERLTTALGLPRYVEGGELGDEGDILAIEERPGRYSKRSEYSRGGMGRILIVHDEYLSRDIALKELLPPTASGREAKDSPMRASSAYIARFLREAKVTGQLEHPSIVPVYELGRREDGTLYYTMKLVRGQTFKKALETASNLAERLDLLSNFVDLCYAIGYAHSRGVIHRDIKPGNVMLGGFGETVVIDWGLAKIVGVEDDRDETIRKTIELMRGKPVDDLAKTQAGLQIGTPSYMAPEQAEGKIDELDARTDVFALGVVLYEVLTGHVPFEGKTSADVMSKIVNEDPPPIRRLEPDAPAELVTICQKAIQKDPEDRYQKAEAFAEDVRRFQTGALVSAYSYSLPEVLVRYYRRHRAMVNTVASGLLLLLVVAVYSYVSIRAARDEAERSAYSNGVVLAGEYQRDGNFGRANEILQSVPEKHRNWEWGHLVARSAGAMHTFENYTSGRLLPGRNAVVLGGPGRPAVIRSLDDAVQETEIHVPTGRFNNLEVHSTLPLVAVAEGRTVFVYNYDTGRLINTLRGHFNTVEQLEFGADGDRLLTRDVGGRAIVWSVESGEQRRLPITGSREYRDVRFDSDSSIVVYWGSAGSGGDASAVAGLWDVESEDVLFERRASAHAYASEDGVSYIGAGNRVEVWRPDLSDPERIWGDQPGAISYIELSADGGRAAVVDEYGNCFVYDTATGSVLSSWHERAGIRRAHFSRDSEVVLTISRLASNARIWEASSGRLMSVLDAHGGAITDGEFSPDGERIITWSRDRSVRVWPSASSGASRGIWKAPGPTGHFEAYGDPPIALVTTRVGDTYLVDARSGNLLGARGATTVGSFTTSALSETGALFVVPLDAFTLGVFRVDSTAPIGILDGHDGAVFDVAISRDESRIVTVAFDSRVRVWRTAPFALDEAIAIGAEIPTAVAVSRDGEWMAVGTRSGQILARRLLSSGSMEALGELQEAVSSLAFGPGGRYVVAGGLDGSLTAFDVSRTGPDRAFGRQRAQVYSIYFDARGERMFTGGGSAPVTIWDWRRGEQLATGPDYLGPNDYVAFSDVLDAVLVTTPDGTLTQVLGAITPEPETAPANQIVPGAVIVPAGRLREVIQGALQGEVVQTIGEIDALVSLGLRPGDVVEGVGGEAVSDSVELRARLEDALDLPAGASMSFTVRRGYRAMELAISERALEVEERDWEVERAILLEAIRQQLDVNQNSPEGLSHISRDYAAKRGVDAADGVFPHGIVLTVARNEEGNRLLAGVGLSPGDRILEIDGATVNSIESMSEAMAALAEAVETNARTTGTVRFMRGEFRDVTMTYLVR